jgi:hypothetical protein
MSLAPWSVFDARWAKSLIKLQRLLTDPLRSVSGTAWATQPGVNLPAETISWSQFELIHSNTQHEFLKMFGERASDIVFFRSHG